MKTYAKAYIVHRPAAMLLFTALLLTAAIAGAVKFDPTHAGYDALLKQFVSEGRVDYQGLKDHGAALDRYLDGLAGVSEATFYLSALDGDYLKAGGYAVKYLVYDWTLNAK